MPTSFYDVSGRETFFFFFVLGDRLPCRTKRRNEFPLPPDSLTHFDCQKWLLLLLLSADRQHPGWPPHSHPHPLHPPYQEETSRFARNLENMRKISRITNVKRKICLCARKEWIPPSLMCFSWNCSWKFFMKCSWNLALESPTCMYVGSYLPELLGGSLDCKYLYDCLHTHQIPPPLPNLCCLWYCLDLSTQTHTDNLCFDKYIYIFSWYRRYQMVSDCM